MAATSFHPHGLGQQGKITKSRARGTVKPILKKLQHSSSHSERNSLDLDRGWDEQESPYLGYVAPDCTYAARAPRKHPFAADASPRLFDSPYPPAGTAAGTGGRSVRDVSFDLSSTDLCKTRSGGTAGGDGLLVTATVSHSTTASSRLNSASATPASTCTSASTSNHFSHVRSTSGVSNISTTTSASGGRNGSFVHPFQQTPQTSTPPLLLSSANLAGPVDNAQRDYSPTITENDADADDVDPFALPNPNSKPLHTLPHTNSNSSLGYRRPSLGPNQRTNSLSDVTPKLRVSATATRTNSGTLAYGASYGPSAAVNHHRLSDGQLGTSPSVTVVEDSPIGPSPLGSTTPQLATSYSAAPASPMSPLRHSFDMNHFRIRSRSDVDTATRQEQVRQARRKFEEKERAKEEKYAREQVRKRERADTKEAQRQERAQSRKGSFHTVGRASTSEIRPQISRKSTSHNRPPAAAAVAEKFAVGDDFTSQGYDEVSTGLSPARADEVHFESNKRTRTSTKHKTTGAWTAFVLWFRTRLLKLGRR